MSLLRNLSHGLAALALSLGAGCAPVDGEEDVELNEIRQEAVAAINGLRTINGLRSFNGLRTLNGLSTRNGLRTLNGLTTMNGLRTFNGFRTYNGLDVDCTGKTAGVTCTGEPDGLLSRATGLMSTYEGLATAKYLVRCALPAGDSIRIKDYTGGLVSLSGELGLTPGWKDGQCDRVCEEKITACLMALTNGAGENIRVELAAQYTLGTGHTFRYQEAAFYGNVFTDPPKAFYCVGDDYYYYGRQLETRACQAYNEKYGSCPYVKAGVCGSEFTYTNDEKRCSFGYYSDTAKTCKEASSWLNSGKTWYYPITTFRETR